MAGELSERVTPEELPPFLTGGLDEGSDQCVYCSSAMRVSHAASGTRYALMLLRRWPLEVQSWIMEYEEGSVKINIEPWFNQSHNCDNSLRVGHRPLL